MKNIAKQLEPDSLTQHRCQQYADYDNYPQKEDLRRFLLKEQGWLCCYCMQRITTGKMKIEHWRSQRRYAEEQLDYRNLLGACPGNEGKARHQQHCDTRKRDDDITFNPADPEHNVEILIRYLGDGTIEADHPEFDRDLNHVLNLNHPRLKANRRAAVDLVISELSRRPGSRTTVEIEGMIHRWSSVDHRGRFAEFCQVVAYYLAKKLRRQG